MIKYSRIAYLTQDDIKIGILLSREIDRLLAESMKKDINI